MDEKLSFVQMVSSIAQSATSKITSKITSFLEFLGEDSLFRNEGFGFLLLQSVKILIFNYPKYQKALT
jgi:hypothetical protein